MHLILLTLTLVGTSGQGLRGSHRLSQEDDAAARVAGSSLRTPEGLLRGEAAAGEALARRLDETLQLVDEDEAQRLAAEEATQRAAALAAAQAQLASARRGTRFSAATNFFGRGARARGSWLR